MRVFERRYEQLKTGSFDSQMHGKAAHCLPFSQPTDCCTSYSAYFQAVSSCQSGGCYPHILLQSETHKLESQTKVLEGEYALLSDRLSPVRPNRPKKIPIYSDQDAVSPQQRKRYAVNRDYDKGFLVIFGTQKAIIHKFINKPEQMAGDTLK